MLMRYFFVFLTLSLIFVCSLGQIAHCEINSISINMHFCLKCSNGYILDYTSTTCVKILELHQANCIQLSIFGECLKCNCGFSLQNQRNICVPTPEILFGCEILDEDFVCIRPKAEFTFFKVNGVVQSIEYSKGSNCEILNLQRKKKQKQNLIFLMKQKFL